MREVIFQLGSFNDLLKVSSAIEGEIREINGLAANLWRNRVSDVGPGNNIQGTVSSRTKRLVDIRFLRHVQVLIAQKLDSSTDGRFAISSATEINVVGVRRNPFIPDFHYLDIMAGRERPHGRPSEKDVCGL